MIKNTLTPKRYDLPLNQDSASSFQIQLTALMVMLSCWALITFVSFEGIANHWVSGISNKLTIELSPISGDEQTVLPFKTLEARGQIIAEKILRLEGVSEARFIQQKEVANMIGSWLDAQSLSTDLPLPGLVSVVTTEDAPEGLVADIEGFAKSVHMNSHVETHKDWLLEFLETIYFLRYAALFLCLLMLAALLFSIQGIIKSRLSTYARDIELLHLIGASDTYIARQFQRHATLLSFKGAQIGLGLAVAGILVTSMFSLSLNSFSEQSVSYICYLSLVFVPILAIGISRLTARFTVLKTLNKLP